MAARATSSLGSTRTRGRAPRSRAGSDPWSRNPSRRRRSGPRRISSIRLTLSTNCAQSNHEIRRMLVITFRTVTFIEACRWCSRRTVSSAVVPSDGQELLEPPERRRHGRVLIAQPLEELDLAGRRQRQARQPAQATRPRVSGFSVPRPSRRSASSSACWRATRLAHDLLGQPSQVLDEQDSQADGDRPELAERQRLDPLVGGHQATQAVGVEPAVGVGDVRPGQAEDPRIALQRTVRELRQLAVVVAPAGRRGSRGAAPRRCGSCRPATPRPG